MGRRRALALLPATVGMDQKHSAVRSSSGLAVSDFREPVLTENGRLVCVVFELKQIVRRIFDKERVVLDSCPGIPHARLLIKGQPLLFGTIDQFLPARLREKNQAEMSRVNPWLGRLKCRHQMRHKLMTCQAKRHRGG